MKRGELLNYLTEMVVEYVPKCKDSIYRNTHMNELEVEEDVTQTYIDAILVDFVNYVGTNQNLDWGLYTYMLYPTVKTSQEWQKLCKLEIMDPDGWNRNPKNFHYEWYDKKISRKEFEKRIKQSTVSGYEFEASI